VDDLLDVGRIAGNKLELRTGKTDLTLIVRQSVEVCRPVFDDAGHLLLEQIGTEPIPMNADPVRMTQVVTNVLNNACKYTAKGGRVTIKVWRNGGEACVSVRDTGRGIPAEPLPRVFDMFTQVGRSFDRNPGGLGVGLTLVKRLVELHGGEVTATSEGAGQGSEFVIRVPIPADTEARTPRVLAAVDGKASEPRIVQ
jgi:signal transduction histidine kinase